MEVWQWALALLAGLSAVFVMGAIIWGVFDVLRKERLDRIARAFWVMLLFVLPLFGILAWLYAKPRLSNSDTGLPLGKTF